MLISAWNGSRSRSRARPLFLTVPCVLSKFNFKSKSFFEGLRTHLDLKPCCDCFVTSQTQGNEPRSRSRSMSWWSGPVKKQELPQCSRSQASLFHLMNAFLHPSPSGSRSAHTMSMPKTVVCVEGNIGCGKTTLLNYFQTFRNCQVVAEPVEKWQNVEGYNALGLMYKDPERWGMALQTYIQLTMLQNHNRPQEQDIRLMERSIYSAKYCFTDNLFESGQMPGVEHVILTKWFDWIIKTQNIKVDLIVYLRTDPELLHQRIMKRCRKEEEGIPVELLKDLHRKYEDWLIHKKHPLPAEVLVIDANHSLEEMQEYYEMHKGKILVTQAAS